MNAVCLLANQIRGFIWRKAMCFCMNHEECTICTYCTSVLYAVIAANLFKNSEFNRILCKPNFPISALGLRNCIPFLCLSLCFLCLSQSFLCLSLCFLCLSLFLSCFSMLPLSVSIPFLCLSLCFLCLSLSFLCLSLCFICLFLCFFARSPCFFSLYT